MLLANSKGRGFYSGPRYPRPPSPTRAYITCKLTISMSYCSRPVSVRTTSSSPNRHLCQTRSETSEIGN